MAATDATAIPIKNQAYRITFPIYDNDGDLVTAAAALDSEVSKDGGTFADCTNEATEIATSSGVYYLDLTATEMNADTVAIIVKTTTTDAKTTVLVLYPAEPADIIVNVKKVNGTDQTAGDLAALVTTVDTVVDSILDDTDDIGVAGAGLTAVPWNAAWDAQVESEVTDALVALHLDHLIVETGTVIDLGANTTSYFDATLANGTATAQHSGNILVFTSGANIRTSKRINVLNATGGPDVGVNLHTVTSELLPVAPSAGDTFVILAMRDEKMRGTDNAALSTFYTSTRAGYLDLLNTNLNATVSSRSSHSAADVWAAGTRTLTSFGTLVADVTSSVWAAGTRTLTSFGSLVADIWAALTSGLTTVGSIGKLLVDNVNATISSRASQTSVDGVQSDTNDIQSKIGTPAGASVSADIAAVKSDTGTIVTNVAAILDDTGTTGVVLTAAERTAIADALLTRDMSAVAGVALDDRKVLNALRTMRNRVTISGTTMTVYAEDDTTIAWTGTITTDAAADPITAVDPT